MKLERDLLNIKSEISITLRWHSELINLTMLLNVDNLREIMRFKPSLADCSAIFQVSEDTISRRISEWENLSFKEFRSKYMAPTKLKLAQRAIEMAMGGNTVMMIFCLKNFCSWSDSEKEDEPEVQYEQSTIMRFPRAPNESEIDFKLRKVEAEKRIGKNIISIAFDPDEMEL